MSFQNHYLKWFSSESIDNNYQKYKDGSTYVPVEITISMIEEERNREVIGVIDNDLDDSGNYLPVYYKVFGIYSFIHAKK